MSPEKGVAIVTGSAQGIGRAIALRLAEDGFDIGLNDFHSKYDQLRAVAEEIEKTGRKTAVIAADATVEEEVKGMVQQVVREFGSLDVMVANAGIPLMVPFLSTTPDDWDRIMIANSRGPFLCYKHAAEQMIKQGRGGRIIGASSNAGKQALPLNAAYSASKFAVTGLTQAAALELGKYDITVNAYAPGLIYSPMTAAWIESGGHQETTDEPNNWLVSHLTRKPIKTLGQPEHVASIVSYLASKEASFITGQCISVDGGVNMS